MRILVTGACLDSVLSFWLRPGHPRPDLVQCVSQKSPFFVFQRSPSERITRWWTPSTNWSLVLLKAACLPKRELFSRRTLLTGRSLNVAPLNPSHRTHSKIRVSMVSAAEGEIAILRHGISQWEEHERGSGSPTFKPQLRCRPATLPWSPCHPGLLSSGQGAPHASMLA